jgi:hypothetical protein
MMTLLRLNNALAIASNCLCPALKLCPPALTSVSSVTPALPFAESTFVVELPLMLALSAFSAGATARCAPPMVATCVG